MPDLDKGQLETRVAELRNRHPCVGLAVGVVRDGALEFSGHGVADIPSRTPVTEDTVVRIASITKTMTAVAVMQMVEHGLIDLDAPANDYLRSYELVPRSPSWRPATVRHLLTHTAGIAEEVPRSAAVRRDYGVGFPLDGFLRRPSSTAAGCGWMSSRAPGSATPTTGPRRPGRSSRTSAACRCPGICASGCSRRSE